VVRPVETAIPFLHRAGLKLTLEPTTATIARTDGPGPSVPSAAVVAALVDCATGLALLEEHEFGYTATTELQVHLTGARAEGSLLRAHSRPQRLRRRSAVLASEVVDEHGTLVAVGRASFEHLGEAAAGRASAALSRGVPPDPQPPGENLDLAAAVATTWDGAELRAELDPDLANPAGNLSGPAIAVVAARAALRAVEGLIVDPVVVSLGISFLAAVRGTVAIAAPTVIGRFGSLVLVDVHLTAGERSTVWAQAQLAPAAP